MKSILIGTIAFITTNIMSAQTKVVDSTAIRIIDRMSTIVGDLKSVSFTLESKVDENDQDIGLNSKYTTNKVYFKGPDKMMMDLQRNNDHLSFWYNGKSLVYYFYNENNYALITCPPTIIETIDMVHDNYGIDFPSADFFNPTLTDDMLRNFDQIRYFGKREINMKECHYIIATKNDMRVQLWIETSAMNLPYKMVIMYLNDGKDTDTQYEATFTNWQINPDLPDSMFEFVPPMEARKIKLMPIKK